MRHIKLSGEHKRVKRASTLCRSAPAFAETLEQRVLLSTVGYPLTFSATNAPIWSGGAGFDKTATVFDVNGGPWTLSGYGIKQIHASLKARAYASSGTVSTTFGGLLSVSWPDTVRPGQQDVPVTISSSLSSGSMSGLLGAGIDVPLSISMTASAGSPINRSATVNTTIMLEDYISKLGLGGIPSSISLNSSGAITPRFGTNSTVTGLASIYNKTTDLVTLCTLIPGVGTYFAYVDPFVDANVSTSLQFQRNDSFTPSSLKGNILVNGSSAGQFALTGATQTVYVDIPQNVGSTVSMDVANLSLANTFNSTLGFNTDAGFQVKVKIPYIASKTLYTLDPPAIFLPVITLPSKTLSFSITDPAAKSIPVESPFSSMPTINSVVQAENFNNGGEGVAYHDMTAGNQGGAYRNTDVDVKLTYDAGTAYCVGNIMNGEWLDYFVNIPSQGRYDVDYRVASSSSANTFSLEANSVAVEDSATDILNTSGKWTTVSTRAALLPAGVVHLRLRVKSTTSGTVALNWLKVRPAALGNHDPNDQLSEANALTVGGSIAGSISTSSDVDMYKFVVPATLVGKNVSVNANKQNPLRPGPAVLLRLFNSAGIELAHSTSKLAPTITYTFKQAGVYFVGVSAAGNHAYNPLTGLLDTGGTPVKSYTLTEVLA